MDTGSEIILIQGTEPFPWPSCKSAKAGDGVLAQSLSRSWANMLFSWSLSAELVWIYLVAGSSTLMLVLWLVEQEPEWRKSQMEALELADSGQVNKSTAICHPVWNYRD